MCLIDYVRAIRSFNGHVQTKCHTGITYACCMRCPRCDPRWHQGRFVDEGCSADSLRFDLCQDHPLLRAFMPLLICMECLMSVCLLARAFVRLFVCMSVCLSVCPSVCLSVGFLLPVCPLLVVSWLLCLVSFGRFSQFGLVWLACSGLVFQLVSFLFGLPGVFYLVLHGVDWPCFRTDVTFPAYSSFRLLNGQLIRSRCSQLSAFCDVEIRRDSCGSFICNCAGPA